MEISTPDDRERATAAAMHVGSIFAPFVVPAVVWVTHRGSVFVASHARKAFFEALFLKAFLVVAAIVSLGYTATTLFTHSQSGWRDFSFWPFVVRFAIGWTALAVLELIHTALSIRDAFRASRGEWPASQKALGRPR